MADSGAGAFALTPRNPNFLTSSLAMSSLALSDGWYSSQKTYLLLSSHNVDAGKHVRAGRIFPNEQHGESELLNPAKFKVGINHHMQIKSWKKMNDKVTVSPTLP